MRHSQVKLATLVCYDDCDDAIRDIESDHRNHDTGLQRWNSGYACDLTTAAQAKVDKITAKRDREFPICDSCGEGIKKSQVDEDGCGLCAMCAAFQIIQ